MSTTDYDNYERVSFSNEMIHDFTNQHQETDEAKKYHEALADQLVRRVLVYGSIGLSVLGVIAFLITGRVEVVLAMNAPLLAVIGAILGRGIFAR